MRSMPPNTRPFIPGDVEVLLKRCAWAERDRVVIFIWSGEAALTDVLVKRRWARLGRAGVPRDVTDGLIRVDVYYAGNVMVCAEIAESGGVARFELTHSGGHLDVSAFSFRRDAAPHDDSQSPVVRAVIVVEARPETETEVLAKKRFPESDDQSQPYPSTTELLALRRALSR